MRNLGDRTSISMRNTKSICANGVQVRCLYGHNIFIINFERRKNEKDNSPKSCCAVA